MGGENWCGEVKVLSSLDIENIKIHLSENWSVPPQSGGTSYFSDKLHLSFPISKQLKAPTHPQRVFPGLPSNPSNYLSTLPVWDFSGCFAFFKKHKFLTCRTKRIVNCKKAWCRRVRLEFKEITTPQLPPKPSKIL